MDTEDGAKILTKILGGETETVRNAVAKKSGASKVDTSKILAMAAPLLLAALGSQKKKTKTQSDGLAGLLWAAAIKGPVRATAATFLPAWRAAC